MAFGAANLTAKRPLTIDRISAGIVASWQKTTLHIRAKPGVTIKARVSGRPKSFGRRETMPAVRARDLREYSGFRQLNFSQ